MLQLDEIIEILKEFVEEKRQLEIILIGGLSMQYYGVKDRATVDIDCEIRGDIEGLFNFLKNRNIPSDIGEDISSWSVLSMPPGYRERAIQIYKNKHLKVSVLNPLDFIIAKIRRFTEEDLNDALYVAKKFRINPDNVLSYANEAIKNSPKDTTIFVFKKNIDLFLQILKKKLA